ncbi:glycoside hydrolase family 3 protein [Cohnella cholangitidis]|uniref:Carbohydrate-binding protein n=1 Tax=Cohnella cholangitidis TaxID=2598458 RepID=A0A7G5C439_9BACL|nr:glycoside hydrolase family 3 protein [Cohnella cholangitidis]QMV43973.1 carbohydrate-binding protein [Cohnella cholangitidis]
MATAIDVTDSTGAIKFKTQVGGPYHGMPLFDGKPEHLEAYVDAYFAYTGIEGPAVYVTGTRNIYELKRGINAGRNIPGALSAEDNVQGVSTDFPSMLAIGQSWNKDLVTKIGDVIGREKIRKLSSKQGVANIMDSTSTNRSSKTVAFSVITDLRINPLSGRFDENYGEDPYLVSTMVDKMASSLSGINDPISNNGFWVRAIVGTKHLSVYNSQWYRQFASNYASARSIFDYHIKGIVRGFESGSVSGAMSSFGRTNGIPNIISSYNIFANQLAKYGMYTSPDYEADEILFSSTTNGALSNGYDSSYAPGRSHSTVLQILAHTNAGRPHKYSESDVTDLVDAVQTGLYGVTVSDLIEAARPHVKAMVRAGLFNEVDSNGFANYYPFINWTREVDTSTVDYTLPEHQAVAQQAARESIVLLKNYNNALPLSKDAKIQLTGIYANTRFKNQYSVSNTPSASETVRDTGYTPLQAILKTVTDPSNVKFDTGNAIFALKAVKNGQYVSTTDAESGDGLSAAAIALGINEQFSFYDWGQEGFSLQAKSNELWVAYSTSTREISNTDRTKLAVNENTWGNDDLFGSSSSLPPVWRSISNSDGTQSFIVDSYSTEYSADFPYSLYAKGRYIKVEDHGNLMGEDKTVGNTSNLANPDASTKFNVEVVKELGADAEAWADSDAKYAIVFVGANVKHSASEGKDRSSLQMGNSDYELIKKVARAFKKVGKKTIVVVETNFPVIMEDIQNDTNVDAIVYQPYGGQYDGKALAEILFGDVAPTGKLTSTWYANMEALPSISKYSIPEGFTTTLHQIDPRFTKDMTNADPIGSRLTYLYTDAQVTYEFGYGLTYSTFRYSNFKAPSSNDGSPFRASVNVQNTGLVKTSEVVQLYINNSISEYGDVTPNKLLVSYEKVELEPGESKNVILHVNPMDFKIWDVNRSDYIVETGEYRLMVGASSTKINCTRSIEIVGDSLLTLDPFTAFNLFDRSFNAHEVTYNEISKVRTVENLKSDKVVGGYYSVTSKGAGSWVAIPKVKMDNATGVTAKVASMANGGTFSLHADSPDHEAFATISVPSTEKVTQPITLGTIVQELGYLDVTSKFNMDLSGIHDIYVVFHEQDIRVDNLAFSFKEQAEM